MSTLTKRCLVLNKTWTPVGTVTLKRAITMLWSFYDDGEPKARIIDHDSYQTFTWADWSKLQLSATDEKVRACNMAFKIPEVILLSRYDRLPQPKVHFSRRTLYKRDNQQCQYCGCKPGTEELTIDHVVPKAQGGTTTWENCVLACVECNRNKRDRTPEQAHMTLRTVPKKPRVNLFRCDLTKPIDSWKKFVSEAFWNVGIGDDE